MRAVLAIGIAWQLALAAAGARAQEEEAPIGDVPTASDEEVLGDSPLRELAPPAPAPATAEARPEAPMPPGARLRFPGEEPRPPIYETWWFWTAVGLVAIGTALAIFVGVTTDAPASAARSPLALPLLAF